MITTEQALAELRETFPGKVIFLTDTVEWWAEDKEPCRATVVGIDYPPSNQKKFTGDTLSEATDQVRVWHKEQSR